MGRGTNDMGSMIGGGIDLVLSGRGVGSDLGVAAVVAIALVSLLRIVEDREGDAGLMRHEWLLRTQTTNGTYRSDLEKGLE